MVDSATLLPSPELKRELEQLASTVTKPRGAILFNRGDEAGGVFLIRKGKVSLGLDYESAIYCPRILSSGAILGLPGTVSGNPYSLTATVVENAELAFVTRDSVLSCLRDNVMLCFQVMEMLSGEICNVRSAFKKRGRRSVGAFTGKRRKLIRKSVTNTR